MKTQIENKAKRTYRASQIEQIKSDNEISLELESESPTGPEESSLMAPEYFNNGPFKNNVD